MSPNPIRLVSLQKGGNSDMETHTRVTDEDEGHGEAATSQGTAGSWERGLEQILPGAYGESEPLSRPSSQASGLQDCERINFCGSKQSWLRYLVTAALGNEHSSLRLPGSRPFQNLGNSFQPLCIQIHQEVKNKPQ